MSDLPVRDPIGLLDRSPELAALAQRVPSLRKAIEAGRPHAAYRALFWASLTRRLGDQAELGKALLSHRRIFFKPLTGAPTMFTYNGIGTSLYGRGDFDSHDGSYVGTLFFVLLFVPLFPISSYLVRDASSGGRRAWSFMAKVPMGAATYLWQRAIALGILAVLLTGTASALQGYGHNPLYVANGLDYPVHVYLVGGDKGEDVAPGATEQLRTTVGEHVIAVVGKDGLILETGTVQVARGSTTTIWNILGAAPVFASHVVYTDEREARDAPPELSPTVFCGQSEVSQSRVDYVFVEPPKSLSMPKGATSVDKLRLGVAPGGLVACINYLGSRGETQKAARLAMSAAQAQRLKAAQLPDGIEALVTLAPLAEALAFTKAVLERDDSVPAHRLYQDVLQANGLRVRAIAEYQARRDARPHDGDAEYLALRMATIEEERTRIDGAVTLYPENKYLRRIELYVHYAARNYAGVVAASEAQRRLDAEGWSDSLEDTVEALVALDRGTEALAMARDFAGGATHSMPERREAEVLALRVAHRLGAPEPSLALSLADQQDDWFPLWVRARAGIEVPASSIAQVKDDAGKKALQIMSALRSDPAAALGMVRSADGRTVGMLPPVARLMLVGEAARLSDSTSLVSKLADSVMPKTALDAVLTYLDKGTLSDELEGLSLEYRAALELARSRAAGLSPKEKADALQRAKADDVLHGPVAFAIAGWPS